MTKFPRPLRLFKASRVVLVAATLGVLAGCATPRPPADATFAVGQHAAIEGTVVRVDTAPWAYDGNAVVTVATTTHGEVAVQLPARWNLCKAQPPEDLQGLKPGDRVQAMGWVSAPGDLVVCERPTHYLQRAK